LVPTVVLNLVVNNEFQFPNHCLADSSFFFLFFYNFISNFLGDDCGGEYSTHIWECNGLGSRAANIGPCKRGCCAPSGKKSFCCKDDACTGCTSSDILKRPTSQPASPVNNDSTNTSVNSSSPSTQPDVSTDTAESDVSSLISIMWIYDSINQLLMLIFTFYTGVTGHNNRVNNWRCINYCSCNSCRNNRRQM
jgi:hypothetical protein